MASRQIELLLNGIQDTNGVPLGAGKVYTYIAGTTTPVTTYTDKNSLTPETNPIILDGNGTAQVYADGVYKLVIKDSDDVTYYTYDNMYVGVSDSQLKNSGTSTGSTNAYILTNDVPSTAYTTLDTYRFIANFANTGVATVNIDGLGVKTIKQYDGTALQSGDIAIDSFNELVYNGTDFLLATNGTALSGSIAGLQTTLTTAIQNGSYIWGGTSGGSANAQTLTLTPTLTAYATGQVFRFNAGYTNTDVVTINIDGLGAKELNYINDGALPVGAIVADSFYEMIYDGSSFRLLSPKTRDDQSFYLSSSSKISTTATSMTLMTGMSQAVTVKVGDIVMIVGSANLSSSEIYGQAKMGIHKDSVIVSPYMTVKEHDDGTTSGNSVHLTANYCETVATAGAYTFALFWETNSGTLYSGERSFSIVVISKN